MLKRPLPRCDLRTLITLLVIISIAITLSGSLYASWRVQRVMLINNTLEANRVFAAKLASTSDTFFQLIQAQLNYSANRLGQAFDGPVMLQEEVERLRQQTKSFNSVLVANDQGVVQAVSPRSVGIQGVKLSSVSSSEALRKRQPQVGQPIQSAANNYLISVSWPIFSPEKAYLGYLAGTFYLKKQSILNQLMEQQYYRDGTTVLVVDENNRVVWYHDPDWVGRKLPGLLDGKRQTDKGSGSVAVTLPDDVSRLAGFAKVPSTGWIIMALTPTSATLQPLPGLLFRVLKNSLPVVLITLLLGWLLARLIAFPLGQLARKAHEMDAPGASGEIEDIGCWYYEPIRIKRALLTGIGLLNEKAGRLKAEVQTDPLTGLLNRRGLTTVLDYFLATRQPFSILALDIDHFKRINDNWGHDVGDEVIRQVATELQRGARQTDVVCRNDGEKFLMILPGAYPEEARVIAERIRHNIAEAWMVDVTYITLSVGVSFWRGDQGDSIESRLRQADRALEEARSNGRNCVVVAGQNYSETLTD